MTNVTQLLEQIDEGQVGAREHLFEAVYVELRRMAAGQMAKEQPGQTLQPTALVHEAWLRLVKSPLRASPSSACSQPVEEKRDRRRYFFATAAEAMRRILVEQARHRHSLRAGGQFQRAEKDVAKLASSEPQSEILAVHEVLDQLAAHDPLKAELVKLRYFAGCTNEEAAELLEITPKRAEKQWVYAKAWLQRRLEADE